MEHSRLLKFLIAERHKNMSENPLIKIETNNESSNINGEVPGVQKIREMDNSVTDANTNTEISDTDTLSPVITVTKKETTLTKGDMKLQKITVTEDISRRELDNGGHILYTENTTIMTDKQIDQSQIMSEENPETSINESRSLEQKRSRIPKLKFRQTVERLKRERREQKLKEQIHVVPRRSSIPKLKDATLIKRPSLKQDWKPEEPLKAEEKLEEEFDKIYEEIVDKPQTDIDDEILAVKIDDPEKVETKFDEIIHAYDSSDDIYLTQTEKLRVSKIPGRKKNTTQLGSLVDKVKTKAPNNSLKDGGFKVSATTITTKRFSRGNSMDLNNQKVDVFEIDTQQNKDGDVIKDTIITETIEHIPITTEITYQSVSKEINLNEPQSMEINEKVDDSVHVTKTIVVDENDSKLSKEVTVGQTKSGIPIKPARINRGISKELNKRPVSLDDRDFVNRKVVKHEELIDGNSQAVFRERVVTEKSIERIPRGISRTFSRDGRSVTMTSKAKESPILVSKTPVAESMANENNNIAVEKVQQNDENLFTVDTKKETLVTEDIVKESVRVGIPVYTKITHSYTKGIIQNVEMSKTIEWKPAEIKIKRYGRSQSEHIPVKRSVIDKSDTETIIKDDSIMYEKTSKELTPIIAETLNNNIGMDSQVIESNNNLKPSNNLIKTVEIDTNVDTDTSVYKPEILNEDNVSQPLDLKEDEPNAENLSQIESDTEYKKESTENEDIQKVTILKGNVNRLISQISENGSEAVTKKEIKVQDEMPKKKSVLSKIAIFEGKDPAELNAKIKKCTMINKIKFDGSSPVNKIYKPNITNDGTKPEIYKMETTKHFGNEPIIVDQIWKIREEDVQKVQNTEEMRIIPETIDITVSDNTNVVFETLSTLPRNLEFDSQDIQHEVNELHEENILISDNKLVTTETLPLIKEPCILSEQIEIREKQPHVEITIPAKIDIITNNNTENIVLYSPEQLSNTMDKNQRKLEKPKVGKLDINFWKKQVEINKNNTGTGKSIDIKPTEVNNVNTSIQQNNIVTVKQVTESPKSPTRIYTRKEVEMPTILPARIDVTHNSHTERPKTLSSKLYSVNECQLQVPIILPETPLMKSERKYYETQTSHVEIPVIFPAKIKLIEDIDILQNAKDTSEENIIHKASVAEVIPELNDDYKQKTPEQNINEIDLSHQPKTNVKGNNLPINTGLVSAKIEVYELKANDVSLNSDFAEIHNFNKMDNTRSENISTLHLDVENNEYIEREVPSDPELVESETEQKETKGAIMGKLRNKIYFITNKNTNSKTSESDNKVIEDNKENNWQYLHTKHQYNDNSNKMYKSYDGVGNADFQTNDDLIRTKSLAELDLGDVVKGQVQRMVYRIKSVDFDKMEVNKSNKINAKEMPRKCSVLEKIALFEGKSSANYMPLKRNKLEQTYVEINSTGTNSTDISKNNTEEIFLKKVEELSSAKLKYFTTKMLFKRLNNGYEMPVIALGTASTNIRLAPHVVSCAIDLGYRAIDTAMIYGNEKAIGEGIKMKIDDGTVSRQDLFIISKLWSTYHKPDLVESACRASLDALGLDYFDLYLIHNPMSFKEGNDPVPTIASVVQFSEYEYIDAWFAMEELVRKGLVRSIGVSNFNSKQIQKILDKGRIKPVVNQVECHPYLSQERLQQFCTERNIQLQCYGVLGAKGTPAEYKAPGVTPVLDDPLVKEMASTLKVSPGRILIGYQLQLGRTVVVSSSSAAHLWDNLQATTFEMEPHDISALTALNKNERIYTLKGMGDTHKNYPFNEPY